MRVTVNPGSLVFHVDPGTPLRDFFIRKGILMDFPCGGTGRCGQCRIYVDPPSETGQGSDDSKIAPDDLQKGVRLACRMILEQTCTVTIPEGKETGVVWEDPTGVAQTGLQTGEAIVTRHRLRVPEPSLEDQRSDWERVSAVLADGGVKTEFPDYTSLEQLSKNLRANNWDIHVLMESRTFLRSCTSVSDRYYGFAVDLGTTTVDVALHNLETGRRVARKTLLNRQTAFGADVISRAQAFDTDRATVRAAALDTIREAATMTLKDTGISPENVVRCVIVGNPIMIHILHDLHPVQLTHAPYINVVGDLVRRKPADFGWDFQGHGFVETLPLISAFVGADTTGMIVALGLGESKGTSVSIDIGTNGEIVLARDGKLYTTSAAAGPAFEGAQIACGTRAVPGAVCDVAISDSSVKCEVLGNEPANGICGTGLIKAVAQLIEAGLLEDTGRLLEPDEVKNTFFKSRFFVKNELNSFALTDDREIYITQKDIRELQLAKGAIRTALDCLLDEVGVSWPEVDLVRLAGNFGAGMNGKAEKTIGLLPDIDLEKIDIVGNAALRGAALALISKPHRQRAARVATDCSFLELAGKPDFQMRFAESMFF